MSKKSTSDIYLAAAFLASGARLVSTNREDVRHMIFEFEAPVTAALKIAPTTTPIETKTAVISVENVIDMEALETQWVNKTMTINAFEYAEAIRRMKSVVHSRGND